MEKILLRNGALDVLKIVLALMIIGMHASFLSDINVLAAYLTSHGLFRIAVPIFLLINGYFFHQVLSTGTFLPWFKRLLVLYLIWMAVYLPFWLPDLHQNAASLLFKFLHTMLFGYYHLWYLAGMLGAALVMVLLRKASTAQLTAAMVASFLGGVALQYAGSYYLLGASYLSKILSLNWAHRNFLLFSFPFFCAGFLINKHKLQERFTLYSVFLIGCLGLGLLFLESYLNFSASSAGAALDNMLSLAVVCPAVFILFMKIRIESNSKEIALYSTGLYLIHILVIFGLQNAMDIPATSLTVLTVIIAAGASYFLILLRKKIPFIL